MTTHTLLSLIFFVEGAIIGMFVGSAMAVTRILLSRRRRRLAFSLFRAKASFRTIVDRLINQPPPDDDMGLQPALAEH